MILLQMLSPHMSDDFDMIDMLDFTRIVVTLLNGT
jgi:hypothetical protein